MFGDKAQFTYECLHRADAARMRGFAKECGGAARSVPVRRGEPNYLNVTVIFDKGASWVTNATSLRQFQAAWKAIPLEPPQKPT